MYVFVCACMFMYISIYFPTGQRFKTRGGQLVARRGVFSSLAFLSGAHTYYARPVNMKLAVHEFCKRAQTPFNLGTHGLSVCIFLLWKFVFQPLRHMSQVHIFLVPRTGDIAGSSDTVRCGLQGDALLTSQTTLEGFGLRI